MTRVENVVVQKKMPLENLADDTIYCILLFLDDFSLIQTQLLNKNMFIICQKLFPVVLKQVLEQRHGLTLANNNDKNTNELVSQLKNLYVVEWNCNFTKNFEKNRLIRLECEKQWICIPCNTHYSTITSKSNYYFSVQINMMESDETEEANVVIGFVNEKMLAWMENPNLKVGESFGYIYSNGYIIHSKKCLYEKFDFSNYNLQQDDIVTVVIKQDKNNATTISYYVNGRKLGVAFVIQQQEKIIPAISIHGTVSVNLLPFSKSVYNSICE